mmetsp:Transcript_88840/g.172042  ORF Transcript_88840/g.172042 Transcript_88840/m.172042 type:complete len:286 (+) Transcript_88840:103-960(+)|eukprot:CAMPEP_0171804076 /NCGR_PEP_ID=MMETSP0991-20121206/73868_1 /TAXON_ID=483369 /ORGANISM="non described non described, Strain CCMP2098" /LENGTH=285 /DNA_ID=CAMNT_0012416325 /DNA_START=130 /DNA_END=987 /DNA_ORIENTATION=+
MDSPMSPMHNDPFGFADGGLSTHEDVAISSTPSPGAAALAHHFEDIPPDLAKPENNQPPPPPTPDEKAPSVPDESCVLASPEEDQGGMMGWLRYSTSPAVAAQKSFVRVGGTNLEVFSNSDAAGKSLPPVRRFAWKDWAVMKLYVDLNRDEPVVLAKLFPRTTVGSAPGNDPITQAIQQQSAASDVVLQAYKMKEEPTKQDRKEHLHGFIAVLSAHGPTSPDGKKGNLEVERVDGYVKLVLSDVSASVRAYLLAVAESTIDCSIAEIGIWCFKMVIGVIGGRWCG